MHRPPLNKNITPEDFRNFYWLKEELIDFCRKEGIPSSGAKTAIAARVEHYLKTGEALKSSPIARKKKTSDFDWKTELLTAETIITDSYKNTQNVRHFFAKATNKKFTFNILFMKWMKENVGKTLADATNEWLRIDAMKKDKNYQSDIPPQLEYNRYFRAFFANNPKATRDDAIRCWKHKKSLPGTNAYEKSDLDFLK